MGNWKQAQDNCKDIEGSQENPRKVTMMQQNKTSGCKAKQAQAKVNTLSRHARLTCAWQLILDLVASSTAGLPGT